MRLADTHGRVLRPGGEDARSVSGNLRLAAAPAQRRARRPARATTASTGKASVLPASPAWGVRSAKRGDSAMRVPDFARAAATVLMALALVRPAAGQFDPQHDRLKCHKIKGPSHQTLVQTDSQFGRERIFRLPASGF